MEPIEVIEVSKAGLLVLLKLSMPLLLTALFVGLVIALIQALTQIQEPTLAFVPKIIAVFLVLMFTLPFMGRVMGTFSNDIMSAIIQLE